MLFMPIEEWLSQTSSWRHARSDSLKALDSAITSANLTDASGDASLVRYLGRTGDFSESEKSALALDDSLRKWAIASVQKAFVAWAMTQTRKGQDWRDSVRNGSGAVTTLHKQLSYWQTRYPAPDTQAALALVVKARNESLPALFANCECIAHSDMVSRMKDRVKKANAAKNTVKIIRNTTKLVKGGGAGSSAAGPLAAFSSQMNDMVKNAFGVSLGQVNWGPAEKFFEETLADALKSISDEIAALAPGAGLALSTSTLVFQAIKITMQSIAADEMLCLTRKLESGDSQEALLRVRDWQLRDIALRVSKAARAGVNVGAQSAAIASCGVGIPAQLAIGIANAIVALAEVIADLGIQYKESRAITKYFDALSADKQASRDIFAASPLVGAYYLLNTPTSHIALQLVTLGAPAWQEDVELLKNSKVLKTVIAQSANVIDSSRYRIVRKDGGRFREREGKTLAVKAQELVGKTPLRGAATMESQSSSTVD
jgi:hypothetical protein